MTEPRRQRLWTLPFVTLSVSRTAVGFTFYLLVPTIAAYAIRAYDVTEEGAGWASSSFFFGALIARALSGWVLQRHGSRAVVLTSLAGLLLASLGYLLPVGFAGLLALRTAHGIGFGFAATALTSAAMILAPATRRAEASGWFLVGVNLATGLAPFIALALVTSSFGDAGVFWLTAAFAIAALLAALPVARSIPGPPEASGATGAGLRGLMDARALPIAGVAGLCTLAYGAILTYLNLHAAERGLLGAAGFFFLIYAAVTLVSRPLSGILQDRGNDDVVMIPLLVVCSAGIALTAVATSPVALFVAAGLLGLGMGTTISAGQAVAVAKVGSGRIGLGLSTYWVVIELGSAVGPLLFGFLARPLGFGNMFLVAATFPLAALLLYVLVARRVASASD
ncbi:MFS transporter [Ammonicoccus fulvus]|uniref:MFS transporter n=1 Tax=Ammonicoccus fulvus TaxID=3138240 RepID=A0ABZ3FPB1_9ACTN